MKRFQFFVTLVTFEILLRLDSTLNVLVLVFQAFNGGEEDGMALVWF
jgi:hypothetical protein